MEGYPVQQWLLFLFIFGHIVAALNGGYIKGFTIAIQFIADQRVAEVLHVYPYLVGTAGMYLELHKCI